MLVVDGALGEGGGQVVRSALALSLVTQQAVRIDNIRAKRSKPGLMKQHLTAVLAAAELGAAELKGAQLGSSRLTFVPSRVPTAGNYEFKIGTAGSTMLVLQTILPPLMLLTEPSTVAFEGGTHNPLAPPFEFIERVYRRMLEIMSVRLDLKLMRPGFYPKGGGRCELTLEPSGKLGPLTLLERGSLRSQRLIAAVANLPLSIAERECARALASLDWPAENAQPVNWDRSLSAGNIVFAELDFQNVTELCTAIGERGKSAERVADDVVAQVQSYLRSDAPVGEYLADQLLLPMGLGAHHATGGGCFRTGPLSDHSRTHIALLKQFLDIKITTEESDDGTVTVDVGGSA